ncbi:hypothetical protein K3172_08395 [Qipengyuania sp. 6B39]|uniref:hypothetical protein n=1 Tax=Qipengyuania proteolytica TaxID=2867239 RepID=UPI001C88E27E|nr:hypothetical protein [Qipengyuania proteolytica]MBX7495874.1 hypothetical protein [Qipengyuania proteolytica]
MLKRLLACLAFISGLAAVGAPAHASVAGALDAALELSQKADQPGKGETSTCSPREREQKAKADKTAPCRPSSTVTVVIPTVMFGPDRAFE